MKHVNVKRILTAILAVVLLASCGACLVLPSAAAEVSVLNGTGSRGAVEVTGY